MLAVWLMGSFLGSFCSRDSAISKTEVTEKLRLQKRKKKKKKKDENKLQFHMKSSGASMKYNKSLGNHSAENSSDDWGVRLKKHRAQLKIKWCANWRMKRHKKLKAGARKRLGSMTLHGWYGCKARGVRAYTCWPQHHFAVQQVTKKPLTPPRCPVHTALCWCFRLFSSKSG